MVEVIRDVIARTRHDVLAGTRQSQSCTETSEIATVAKTTGDLAMTSHVAAYIGLGSNLGNREETIRKALQMMGEIPGIRILKISSFIETKPVGMVDQPDFINAVAAIETSLAPHDLLDVLQTIENKLGRVREQRWGPRTIDLDILFYGFRGFQDSRLTIPHPGLATRDFLWDLLKELSA